MRTPDLFQHVPRSGETAAERHSRLALRAARRLKTTARRERAARLVCHHLRCMLDAEASGAVC